MVVNVANMMGQSEGAGGNKCLYPGIRVVYLLGMVAEGTAGILAQETCHGRG